MEEKAEVTETPLEAELVENVETHSKKMHATIFDEELRLLWWAMKTEGDQAPTSDFKLKPLKETVRMLTAKETGVGSMSARNVNAHTEKSNVTNS